MPLIGGLGQLGSMSSLMGQNSAVSEMKDREAIEMEFNKHQLETPVRLSGKAAIDGSLFFPVTSQPRALIVHYRNGKGPVQLKLVFEKLSSADSTHSEK